MACLDNDTKAFLTAMILVFLIVTVFAILTVIQNNNMTAAVDEVCSSLNYTKATDYTWIPYEDAFERTFREDRYKIECDFKVIQTYYTIDSKYCVEYDKWDKCIDTKYKFNAVNQN